MSSLSSAFSKKRGSRLNSMNNLADNPGEERRGRHGRPATAVAQSVAISGQSGEDRSEMAMGSGGSAPASCSNGQNSERSPHDERIRLVC